MNRVSQVNPLPFFPFINEELRCDLALVDYVKRVDDVNEAPRDSFTRQLVLSEFISVKSPLTKSVFSAA